MAKSSLINVAEAIQQLQQGRMVIVVDDKSRENEGDLVIAADFIQPAHINFMATYGRGLICMPMTQEYFQRLGIPAMTSYNGSQFGTAFGVSIGARAGITTGISAADRAETVRIAADPTSTTQDIVMPGHIFPLRAQAGGVLKRPGHTEASTDLMRLAGLNPAAVICEIMNPDGTMARNADLELFCKRHNLGLVHIKDIVAYRLQQDELVHEVSSADLPVAEDTVMRIRVFASDIDGCEHVILQSKETPQDGVPLVRIHSECLTGDILGSLRCDCGSQLQQSIQKIAAAGGALLYMRQEGRGIGLANKVKAYALQDKGCDTVVANKKLGFAADARDYSSAIQMLRKLGYSKLKLMTNNPAKLEALQNAGIEVVERLPAVGSANKHNAAYLKTKQEKLGHILELEGV